MLSISVESLALRPVQLKYVVTSGSNVSLVVHAAGFPNVTSDDIQWSYVAGDRQTRIPSDGDHRRVLMNGDKTLLINSVVVQDGATYHISLRKMIHGDLLEATTSIVLDVQGMSSHLLN